MRSIGSFIVGLTLATLVVSAPPEEVADAERPVRFHADSKATLETALEVKRALLLEDPAAARKAMDRLHEDCRRLQPEDDEVFGEDVVGSDRAYHIALRRAREYAGDGGADAAFDEFMWVERTCRVCHRVARKEGRLPGSGPL